MTQEPRYLTAAEAAERLTGQGLPVSAETLKRWAREGRITAFRTPSGQYRFPADVDASQLLEATGPERVQ